MYIEFTLILSYCKYVAHSGFAVLHVNPGFTFNMNLEQIYFIFSYTTNFSSSDS